MRPAGIYGPGSYLEIPAYKKVRAQRWILEVSGGIIVHPTYVGDVVQAVLAVVEQPAPHATVFNIGGERPIRLYDLQALVAETLEVPRWRMVLPFWIAGPLAAVAKPLLAFLGRPNPLLGRMSRGHLFSAAVDDRRFRERYPNVPVARLKDGLREYIDWASTHGLL